MKTRTISANVFTQLFEKQTQIELPGTRLYPSADKGCFLGIRDKELQDIQGYIKSLKSTESKFGPAWTFEIVNEEEHMCYHLETLQSSYPAFTILSSLAYLLQQNQTLSDIWLVFCIGTMEQNYQRYANVRLTLDGETLMPLQHTAEKAKGLFLSDNKEKRITELQSIVSMVQAALL